MRFVFRNEDFIPGMTNYMHLLGAVHFHFYIKKWGTLYCSQYGHAHTSQIDPLLKWFWPLAAWTTGNAETYFCSL